MIENRVLIRSRLGPYQQCNWRPPNIWTMGRLHDLPPIDLVVGFWAHKRWRMGYFFAYNRHTGMEPGLYYVVPHAHSAFLYERLHACVDHLPRETHHFYLGWIDHTVIVCLDRSCPHQTSHRLHFLIQVLETRLLEILAYDIADSSLCRPDEQSLQRQQEAMTRYWLSDALAENTFSGLMHVPNTPIMSVVNIS